MNALLKLSRNYGYDNLIELVPPLLKSGIDVNATDPDGWNALHYLCSYYKRNTLTYLIRVIKLSNINFEAETKEKSVELYHSALINNPAMIHNVNKIAKFAPRGGSLFQAIEKVI